MSASRARAARRRGRGSGASVFRVAYSVASVLAIALLVQAWQGGGYRAAVVRARLAALVLLALAMLPAFVLFACSLIGNPTAVGGAGLLARGPRGIQRVTRHPMLWSFAIWAAVSRHRQWRHARRWCSSAPSWSPRWPGMPSIDAKMAANNPGMTWPGFAGASSILPFGAILAGRNRLDLKEIGWIAPLAGLVLWAGLLHAHRHVFGVPALHHRLNRTA